VAYQKSVPTNALPYAEVSKIGGMTYRDAATSTLRNTPVTSVKSVGVNLIESIYGEYQSVYIPSGTTITASSSDKLEDNIYLVLYDESKTRVGSIFLNQVNSESRVYGTVTTTQDIYYVMFAWANVTEVIDGQLQIGSQPTAYTPYREPIVVPIPESVQAIDGYGYGVNENFYNYIDWGRKQFVKNVEKDYFANLTIIRVDAFIRITLSKKCYGNPFGYGISNSFNITRKFSADLEEGEAMISPSINEVFFKTSLSVEEFREQYANGYVVYAMNTPEITDISDLLSVDNYIKVSPNGLIIFENTQKNPVPSTVTFQTKEAAT
jgi:hypothetical protein